MMIVSISINPLSPSTTQVYMVLLLLDIIGKLNSNSDALFMDSISAPFDTFSH